MTEFMFHRKQESIRRISVSLKIERETRPSIYEKLGRWYVYDAKERIYFKTKI